MSHKKQPQASSDCPNSQQNQFDGHRFAVESPEWAAAQTLSWILYGKQLYSAEKVAGLMPLLLENMTEIRRGELLEAERLLLSQAEVLQAFFNRTLGLAALMMDHPEKCDRYASLALRAQDQCRKTLIALADLKNPKKPAQFIKNYVDKQLNQLKVEPTDDITAINSPPTAPHTLETPSDAPMDTSCQTTTARANPNLAAVEVSNGTDNH